MAHTSEVDSALLFIATSILASHSKTADTTPELLGVVGINGLVQLSQIYGGRNIYIPTPHQLGTVLRAAVAGYLRYHYKLPWEDIARRLELTPARLTQVRTLLREWEDFLDRHGVDLDVLFVALFQKIPDLPK